MSLTRQSNVKLQIRKPYEPTMPVRLISFEPTLAQQQFSEECDINTIMDRYAMDGILDHVNKFEGTFGDFTNAVDYQASLNQVMDAEAAFLHLPAKVRARFGNDPAQLMDFLSSSDPELVAESVRLGLREAPPPPEPPSSPSKAPEGGAAAV